MTELQNELQNDRMTDRTKTICPPIFDLGGIKIKLTPKHLFFTSCGILQAINVLSSMYFQMAHECRFGNSLHRTYQHVNNQP